MLTLGRLSAWSFGEYGSGKTFFLNLVRSVALEKKLVVTSADLNPDRRLHASSGQARSLYAELMRTLATRNKPEGGALGGVVEKFVTGVVNDAKSSGKNPEQEIRRRLESLQELVNGYDFADVISAYWRGFQDGNEQLKSDAVRWLRGEFNTKTDARQALGVRNIVDDASVYDQLKLLGRFVRIAGYGGLLVCLDELVNLYKLANTQARNANYKQILRILNDSLQGSTEGLGFVLGGTPDFLLDTRRGLYSYPALQSRLAENSFAQNGLVDFTGPVVRLASLSPEEFYVLLGKLRHVYASGDAAQYLLPDDGITAFMARCQQRLGETYFRTPRTTITAFINLLSVLDQNPGADWRPLLGQVDVQPDHGALADHEIIGEPAAERMSSPASDSESAAFSLLDPRIQRWIWQAGWTELKDAQERAIPLILEGRRDVIIAAATASGKTEAAFFPILTRMLKETEPVSALYISPLKALINDQWERLTQLCETLEIPVIPWHGDISASVKKKFLKEPRGCLLITPESLEGLLMREGHALTHLLGGLRYVVIDELHAFLESDRGKQLQSLLNRIDVALGRRTARIALSATLGEMELAAEFLRPDAGGDVDIIDSRGSHQEMKVIVKGFLNLPPLLTDEEIATREMAGTKVEREDALPQGIVAIGQQLFATLRGSNNLIFPNSRAKVELYADVLRRACERNHVPNEFWPHHGSLSKEIREDAERALKSGERPASAIATTTLELGIDIGAVKSIAQVGPAPSVASLRQRLGRSGRRRGEAAILRC